MSESQFPMLWPYLWAYNKNKNKNMIIEVGWKKTQTNSHKCGRM
jgi:hypothetical protein